MSDQEYLCWNTVFHNSDSNTFPLGPPAKVSNVFFQPCSLIMLLPGSFHSQRDSSDLSLLIMVFVIYTLFNKMDCQHY
jgi:hypothetical protein